MDRKLPHLSNEVYGAVYEKNHVIFRQGDPGDCMYVIQSGAVEVGQRRGDEETVLAILEKGDFFGEMALLGRQPRSATVTTIQRSRLVALSPEFLQGRVRQSPQTALHLLRTMIRRIQRADRRMKNHVDGDRLSAEGGAVIEKCLRRFDPCLSCATH